MYEADEQGDGGVEWDANHRVNCVTVYCEAQVAVLNGFNHHHVEQVKPQGVCANQSPNSFLPFDSQGGSAHISFRFKIGFLGQRAPRRLEPKAATELQLAVGTVRQAAKINVGLRYPWKKYISVPPTVAAIT